MADIDSNSELQEAIVVLESKQQEELDRLKREFNETKESLKPKNLAKQGLNRVRHSSNLKTGLIVTGVALISGIIVKKIASKKKNRMQEPIKVVYMKESPATSQVKKISSQILRYAIASLIAQNSHRIKDIGYKLINRAKNVPPQTRMTDHEDD